VIPRAAGEPVPTAAVREATEVSLASLQIPEVRLSEAPEVSDSWAPPPPAPVTAPGPATVLDRAPEAAAEPLPEPLPTRRPPNPYTTRIPGVPSFFAAARAANRSGAAVMVESAPPEAPDLPEPAEVAAPAPVPAAAVPAAAPAAGAYVPAAAEPVPAMPAMPAAPAMVAVPAAAEPAAASGGGSLFGRLELAHVPTGTHGVSRNEVEAPDPGPPEAWAPVMARAAAPMPSRRAPGGAAQPPTGGPPPPAATYSVGEPVRPDPGFGPVPVPTAAEPPPVEEPPPAPFRPRPVAELANPSGPSLGSAAFWVTPPPSGQ
jgi:hypothetical protein